jgi:hypothetical protein
MEYRVVHIMSDLHLGGYTGVPDGASDWIALPEETVSQS